MEETLSLPEGFGDIALPVFRAIQYLQQGGRAIVASQDQHVRVQRLQLVKQRAGLLLVVQAAQVDVRCVEHGRAVEVGWEVGQDDLRAADADDGGVQRRDANQRGQRQQEGDQYPQGDFHALSRLFVSFLPVCHTVFQTVMDFGHPWDGQWPNVMTV